MPAASQGKLWQRVLRSRAPMIFKRCPAGLLHARWDQFCFCRQHEHVGDWKGGIYDFRLKREIANP